MLSVHLEALCNPLIGKVNEMCQFCNTYHENPHFTPNVRSCIFFSHHSLVLGIGIYWIKGIRQDHRRVNIKCIFEAVMETILCQMHRIVTASICSELLHQANTLTKDRSQKAGSFCMRCLNYVDNLIMRLRS